MQVHVPTPFVSILFPLSLLHKLITSLTQVTLLRCRGLAPIKGALSSTPYVRSLPQLVAPYAIKLLSLSLSLSLSNL